MVKIPKMDQHQLGLFFFQLCRLRSGCAHRRRHQVSLLYRVRDPPVSISDINPAGLEFFSNNLKRFSRLTARLPNFRDVVIPGAARDRPRHQSDLQTCPVSGVPERIGLNVLRPPESVYVSILIGRKQARRSQKSRADSERYPSRLRCATDTSKFG